MLGRFSLEVTFRGWLPFDKINCPSWIRFPLLYASCSRDEQIKDQIEVLNRDYTGTGLTFKLVNTTRTRNRKWFENVAPATPEQEEMKKKLRCGGPNALNVFSVSFDNKNASDFLGYATLPSGYNDNPKDDGVVVRYSTLPGGIHAPTNLGRTLTHETGHWVGLYHTFEGGCEGKGDYVSDTPPEADAAHGCPAGRRTCGSKGLDRKLDPDLT